MIDRMSRTQRSPDFKNKLIVDLFAGGGGASTGIFMAIGRHPDIAINHDKEAIALHKANHPTTHHIISDIFEVNPNTVALGQPIGLLWASPDCKHFSKAKGGKPKDKKIRSLAWVVIKWAKAKRPDIIILENVEEFKDWCPLDKEGKAIESKKGATFKKWKNELTRLGYEVDYKEIRACDYGAPTTRKRLYLVARCDGQPIVFPKPTHKPKDYKSAAALIDWSLPCPSIFSTAKAIKEEYGINTKRPLAEKTLNRIAKGVKKFIIDNPNPYIVKNKAYALQSYYGEQKEETRGNRHALVCAYLAQHNLGNIGRDAEKPLSTITTTGSQQQVVQAFLTKFYGQGTGQSIKEPIHTIKTGQVFGLVIIKSKQYQIIDIGMRMLTPRELYNAQGFPKNYKINIEVEKEIHNKKQKTKLSKTAQIRMCGNSVCPPAAAALVEANYFTCKEIAK